MYTIALVACMVAITLTAEVEIHVDPSGLVSGPNSARTITEALVKLRQMKHGKGKPTNLPPSHLPSIPPA